MKSNFRMSVLAILITIIVIAPSAFLFAPPKAHAIFGIGDIDFDPTNFIENTITAIATPVAAIADTLSQVNSYVLQPLALALSGNLLKSITASVTSFVTGKSNGTGKSQFSTNLQGELQTTGDVQALAFFAKLKSSNSPFAAAITSSLTNNYLQNTSLAGFFASNQCTLSKSSPNINSFLAGNWSEGGVGAWFALTTQNQNNPYTLYQTSQSQLASVVSAAQSAQVTQLNWGQGIASWCGPTTSSSGSSASCTNKDGSPGKVQTPGSVIAASLNKALGTDQDKLAQLGSAGSEINSLLSDVGTVMQTMTLMTSIVNGASNGGLLGVSNTSATNRTSAFSQYQSTGFLGATPASTVNAVASTLTVTTSSMQNNISKYQSAWNSINTMANTASTSIMALINNNGCIYNETQAKSEAQTALTTEIAPVVAQVSVALTTVANANALLQKLQNDPTTDSSGTAYALDIATLQTTSPTNADVASAQGNATENGTALPGSDNPFDVSGGSITDQMDLISQIANYYNSTLCNWSPTEFHSTLPLPPTGA